MFRTSILAPLTAPLVGGAEAPRLIAALSGAGFGLVSNLTINLPAGLVATTALHRADAPHQLAEAVLAGIDLGLNLSVTGSLALILWLVVLRREGIAVGAGQFLKIGLLVLPVARCSALTLLLI